jgi:hypothetical protein
MDKSRAANELISSTFLHSLMEAAIPLQSSFSSLMWKLFLQYPYPLVLSNGTKRRRKEAAQAEDGLPASDPALLCLRPLG